MSHPSDMLAASSSSSLTQMIIELCDSGVSADISPVAQRRKSNSSISISVPLVSLLEPPWWMISDLSCAARPLRWRSCRQRIPNKTPETGHRHDDYYTHTAWVCVGGCGCVCVCWCQLTTAALFTVDDGGWWRCCIDLWSSPTSTVCVNCP